MISPERMDELAALCERLGIWLISDEIYHGLTYGMPAATAAACGGHNAIVINSFSKYFSMTGWRIGWMVVPERLVRRIERLAQNLYISPPAIAQAAALGAFDANGGARSQQARLRREPRAAAGGAAQGRVSTSSRPPTAPSISTATSAPLPATA